MSVTTNQPTDSESPPWRDPTILTQLYWDQEMSLRETADELGCSKDTVRKWMKRFDIDLRPPNSETLHPSVWMSDDGYTYYSARVGDKMIHVSQHQLLALLEGYSPEDVFAEENHVHHRIRLPSSFSVPQLDVSGNLEVMEASEHLSGHRTDAHEEPDIETILDN